MTLFNFMKTMTGAGSADIYEFGYPEITVKECIIGNITALERNLPFFTSDYKCHDTVEFGIL